MIEQIRKLIDIKLDNLNTVTLGKITEVDLTKLRCNVKLKNKIQGQEIELFDVPVAVPKFHDSVIILAPKEGDIVLIIFSKYELEEQLKNKDIVDVNELLKFNLNNAIVLAGIFTMVDEIPSELDKEMLLIKHKTGNYIKLDKDENMLLQHKSGNYIKFGHDGKITIKGDVYVDGDLDFKTIAGGTPKEDGVWHKHI